MCAILYSYASLIVSPNDHTVHSRAYCLMADVNSLVAFHKAFDGHVFRSKSGESAIHCRHVRIDTKCLSDYSGIEHQVVVEYAPVQKTPLRVKVKQDARQGTIGEGLLNHLRLPCLRLADAPRPRFQVIHGRVKCPAYRCRPSASDR